MNVVQEGESPNGPARFPGSTAQQREGGMRSAASPVRSDGNNGMHPSKLFRGKRVAGISGIAAALALASFLACSPSPAPHVGEWSGQMHYKDFTNPLEAQFLFHHDSRVEYRLNSSRGATENREGSCRIEYDKFPPRLYLEFSDGTSLIGLVTFFGREKTIMHIGIVTDGPPNQYSETKRTSYLRKWKGKCAPPRNENAPGGKAPGAGNAH